MEGKIADMRRQHLLELDQEKEKLDSDVKTVFDDYREDERKFHYNNI